jgi:hypothetical protein
MSTLDIVARLRAWSEGAREQSVQDVANGLAYAADEIERLREENRQLRERSTEAVIAWINETIKRAGEAHILKRSQDGV